MTQLADPTTLRSRTITWTDPLATLDEARTMSGLRVVQGLISGELERPPISSLLDMKVTRADEGIAEMTLEPGEHFSNPMEMVHGGVVATLLDSAMGLAVHSLLQAGERYATLELKTNFLRPVAADTSTIRAEGVVLHYGKTSAVAEGKVYDQRGHLVALGSTTCSVQRLLAESAGK